MKTALLLLTLCLTACTTWTTPEGEKDFAPEAVVSLTYGVDTTPMCTAVAVGPNTILTAAHCLMPDMKVDGQPTKVLFEDGKDHALVSTVATQKSWARVHREAKAGKHMPVGLKVTMWGHGLSKPLFLRHGRVSGIWEAPLGPTTMVDIEATFGDSGSALFSRGVVVATLSGGVQKGAFGQIFLYPYAFTAEQWEEAGVP